VARCIADMAASRFRVQDERERHIVLSRIHLRMSRKLEDDYEDALSLQRQHANLVRERLKGMQAAEQGGKQSQRSETSAGGACVGSLGRRDLRQVLQETQAAYQESLSMQQACADGAMRRNADAAAKGMASAEATEAELGPELRRIEAEALSQDREEAFREDIHLCMVRQQAVRMEMSAMEETLVSLEVSFAQSRRGLLGREVTLSKQIGDTEVRLAELSGSLSGKREAARQAGDALLEARQELAVGMVRVPAQELRGAALEAFEADILAEVQALRARAKELQKRYTKAKAAAKKH